MELTPRPTRRRTATRQRLLDAAFEVFAEEGFGRSTVEQVCRRAGFTRGAFYSNFTSLNQLFLAVWEQRSRALAAAFDDVLQEHPPSRVTTVREAVEAALTVVPIDEDWYRVSAEFTAHALRIPGMRSVIAAREESIQRALLPMIEGLLAMAGREIVDRDTFGQAIVAVHDGTALQCLLDPADDEARRRRTELFVVVVEHHTRPVGGS